MCWIPGYQFKRFNFHSINASNDIELFPLNLKCLNMHLNPEAKVTLSGADIVFDVVICRRELLAAWAEYLLVGDNKAIQIVNISPVFEFTLHPSPTRATCQFSNNRSSFFSARIIISRVMYLKTAGGVGAIF